MHQPSLSPPRRCGATTVAMPAHGPTAWSEITTEYEDEYHYGEQLAAGKGHVTEQQRKGKQLGSFVLLDARTPAQKEETQAKLRALPPRNADAPPQRCCVASTSSLISGASSAGNDHKQSVRKRPIQSQATAGLNQQQHFPE